MKVTVRGYAVTSGGFPKRRTGNSLLMSLAPTRRLNAANSKESTNEGYKLKITIT